MKDKENTYLQAIREIHETLDGEKDLVASMATISSILHHHFPYFFWTGFYRRVGETQLLVGPYQGTLGCLHISFDRGVCGACATKRETIIVPDVHQFPGHIACSENSLSEIVVPVFDKNNKLIAVFDVDSDELDAFSEIDKKYLEKIVETLKDKI